MSAKKTRLEEAEMQYCGQMQEWLTNPKNEDLPSEVVEAHIEAAFQEFLQALLFSEEETAQFIANGGIMDELDFLPLIFNHFKSVKIYQAIKSNCEAAFLHKHSTESEDLRQARNHLLAHIKHQLGICE